MSVESMTLEEVPNPPSNEPPPPPTDPIKPTGITVPDKFSGKAGDFAKDMALLAAEQGIPNVIAVPEPAQPVQPQATVTPEKPPVIVPEKFQNPDGTLNVARVEASTMSAEQALEKYRQKEVELKRKINEVNSLSRTAPATVSAPPAESIPQSFEEQIEADLKREGAGRVLAKLFAAAKEAAKNEALSDVSEIRENAMLDKRERELNQIAKSDPWVLTEQGVETLAKIRAEKPWLNQAPAPWTAAYREHLADEAIKQRQGSQVTMPTPRGMTAPVAPAVPVNRAASQPTVNTQTMTKEQIDNFLAGKTLAEQGEVFKKLGLPWVTRTPGRK